MSRALGGIPGVGRVIWSRAFGEDAATDRVFMDASVQKTFTATAVLQEALVTDAPRKKDGAGRTGAAR